VRVLDVGADMIEFEVTDTDVSMANALRRVMIAETPTLCIDTVDFEDNTSSLQDEILAHRLGLIPLRSTEQAMSEFNFGFACDCEQYCEKCAVELILDVDYDTEFQNREVDDPDLPIAITSMDLRSSNPDVVPAHFSTDKERQMAQEQGIVITYIGKGQAIKAKCIAKKGIGKEHAKWSPVATVALKIEPIIKLAEEVLNDFTVEEKRDFVESCPKGVFEYDDNASAVKLVAAQDCIFCKECIYLAQDLRRHENDPLAVAVEHSSSTFKFTVESTGALEPKELVLNALDVLSEKLLKAKYAAAAIGMKS